MSATASAADLIFPRPVPPAPGEIAEIAPGILWLRLALPFQLDHVNIYLLEDGPGWAVLDTGIADLRTRTVWQSVLAERLQGRPLTRLIVTHFHPDHLGLAGWMTEELGLELYMSQVEYLQGLNLRHNPAALGTASHRDFYLKHGLDPATTATVMSRGHAYLKLTTGLPPAYHRLAAGERLRIGGRDFEILTGGGHAPEQVMLLCRDEGIFLAADQVLARISPNIGVWPWEPLADPLGAYLHSLAALRQQVPDDALVLPAHNLPFYGLHQRIADLERHHALRCDEIVAACAAGPRTTAEVLPVLFPRALDAHQMGFAFGEVLAHVNHMVRLGRLALEPGTDGKLRVRRT
ncbi:MBL fold metallo-hydrolase [Limobrevibacterium gyesilva]|uniref:MBL fold metallo-hydrolase n=1 Tax=Limobrevibacterium gyesilva TaxID=2991712 RepID=A0AA42CFH8_9PROT|nr:MBL fold metallo-hydrolase [Limobrevibacterium gyesilva]MCW3476644.1 MBL fold metallo-hydrolase [Limobrevibacterium gyesilva]